MKLDQFNRILLQALLLPVLALLCVSGVLVWQILGAERTVARMEIADRNIATASRIEALISDEETGVRGYQNTSNPIFLQPYLLAAQPLQQNLQDLRAGVASQNGDLASVNDLAQAHKRWLYQIAIPMVATVDASGDTRNVSINLRGKAYMDGIRRIEAGIVKSQEVRRGYLAVLWRTEVLRTLEAVVGLALMMGLMIGVFERNRLDQVSEAFRATIEEQRRTQAALLANEKLAVSGRLAAEIAHEIHNPLDSVVNLLYLMGNGGSEQERGEFIDMAQAELTRVSHISRTMLGLYREARDPVDFDISMVLQNVLFLLEHRIREAGLAVETELDPTAVAVGFPNELREVFVHLLTNAAEASDAGATIEVRVGRSHPQPLARPRAGLNGSVAAASDGVEAVDCNVVVSISDQGHGIAATDRERLFRPFFTTKAQPGTGLGLWISQMIVQKHGGTLSVESSTAPGIHGTTVTVCLPCGQGAATAQQTTLALWG